MNLFMLLSSTTGTDTGSTGGLGSILSMILPLAFVFVLMYFFMIRPQKKQEQKDNEMRNSLAVGDEVTTIGGIIGKVVSVKGETCVIETTKDKTKIRVMKWAIRSVDFKVNGEATAKKDAPVSTEIEKVEEKK